MRLDGFGIFVEDLEKMTRRTFAYTRGIQGHFEIALGVPSFGDVDREYARVVAMGAVPVLPPEDEPWGQRTCYIADPEGNLVEIGSFGKGDVPPDSGASGPGDAAPGIGENAS